MNEFHIVVLPGDGIGVEIMDACLALLDQVVPKAGGFRLRFERHAAGAAHYRDSGVAFPDDAAQACEKCDAILFGSMGLPDVRYPDGFPEDGCPRDDLVARYDRSFTLSHRGNDCFP